MDWMNIHIPSCVRSPQYVGSSPSERGTWLSVMAYACEIECGGVLIGAALWKDRQWQQACGVTVREVRAASRLLQVSGQDVIVNGYPTHKEAQVKQARGVGSAGAMKRWGKHADNQDSSMPVGMPVAIPSAMPVGIVSPMARANAEGDGEGEGEGEGERHPIGSAIKQHPVQPSASDRIRPLIGHVRYRTADQERTAENQAELLAMIDLYGIDKVLSVAHGEYAQAGEKIWPDRLGAAIAEQVRQDKRNRLPPPPAEPTWSNA